MSKKIPVEVNLVGQDEQQSVSNKSEGCPRSPISCEA